MLATTREGVETTIRAYSCVAKSLGLTVNIIKTKFMVVGHDIAGGHTANQLRGRRDRACE